LTVSEQVRNQVIDDWLEGKSPSQIARDRGISRSQVYVILKELASGPKAELIKVLAQHLRGRGYDGPLLVAAIRYASVLKNNEIDDLDEAEKDANCLDMWLKRRGGDIDPREAIEARAKAVEIADSLGVTVEDLPVALEKLKATVDKMIERIKQLQDDTGKVTSDSERALAVAGVIGKYIEQTRILDLELRRRGRRMEDAPLLIEILNYLYGAGLTILEALVYVSKIKDYEKMRHELYSQLLQLQVLVRMHYGILEEHKKHSRITLEFVNKDISNESLEDLYNEITRIALEEGKLYDEALCEILKRSRAHKKSTTYVVRTPLVPVISMTSKVDEAHATSRVPEPSPIPLTASKKPEPEKKSEVVCISAPEPKPALPVTSSGITITPHSGTIFVPSCVDPYEGSWVPVTSSGTATTVSKVKSSGYFAGII
jgi:hypothetical protein